jgi:hypothetical protein
MRRWYRISPRTAREPLTDVHGQALRTVSR